MTHPMILIRLTNVVQRPHQSDSAYYNEAYFAAPADYTPKANEVIDNNYTALLFLFNACYNGHDPIDYKGFRAVLKTIHGSTAWTNHSEEMKKVFAEHHVCSQSEFDDIYPDMNDQIEIGGAWDNKSRKNRSERLEAVRAEIKSRVPLAEAFVVMSSFNSLGFGIAYVDGLEGTIQGDPVGPTDWVNSTPGTPFENNGFRQISFTSIRGLNDTNELADRVLKIFNYGRRAANR